VVFVICGEGYSIHGGEIVPKTPLRPLAELADRQLVLTVVREAEQIVLHRAKVPLHIGHLHPQHVLLGTVVVHQAA